MNLRNTALGVLAGLSWLSGCGDPAALRASRPTSNDVFTVFALTGTPAAYPSGINSYVRAAVRVDGTANFDVAFDIDRDGKVLMLPVQKVVSSVGSMRRVGLRKVSGTFESVTSAPTGAYPDSIVVAVDGDVVVMESQRNGANDACQFDISPFIYTKFLIDSISVAARTITVQAVLDPNCGFRSFESGIPSK